MLLAYMLARLRIPVHLFEAQADFNRDFRGDTVHASTLQLFEQLGLIDQVLALPHEKVFGASLHTPLASRPLVSFKHLAGDYPYMALMPQEVLLDYLATHRQQLPSLTLHMSSPVQSLLRDPGSDHITGIGWRHAGQTHTLKTQLVVAADGRFSRMRKLAGLQAEASAPPMDVAWMRVSRNPQDPSGSVAFYVNNTQALVLLPRQGYWQLGFLMLKGDYQQIRRAGIQALLSNVAQTAPFLADRMGEITNFDQVHFLNIKSDCLNQWYLPGFLMIGDAAHVMSPVGGVGINSAISDAIAAVNELSQPLLNQSLEPKHLLAVQHRRHRATRIVQRFQAQVQKRIVKVALQNKEFKLPLLARLLLATPGLRNIPARLIAQGPLPTRLQISLPPTD